jgi:cytosine/adenosine deaminase-related metal-dependent hydrolase
MTLIRGAEALHRPARRGDAAKGAIRIADGRITEIGA